MNTLKSRLQSSRFTTFISYLILLIASSIPVANAQPLEEQVRFSEAELEQMLAPIALYPDSLLTHILIAATYPLELVQANRLMNKNKLLPTAQLMEKAQKRDWDPSVTALLAFPNVLEKLSSDLSWTQDLGDAFLQDEAQMLASIQSLRAQADEANSLTKMENMSVTRVNKQIVIEPVQKEIVYVPYYDPRTVYGHWRWYNYPPVYWAPYPYYVGRPHGHFYWNSGVHISFNFFFSAFHWSNHRVVVIDHRHSHHYRHRGRIVTSHGSQKWHHKPHHRRGVAYRSTHVKQRYNSHRPSIAHSKQLRHAERNSLAQNRKHKSRHDKTLKHYNKQVKQHREQRFTSKLHNSHKPVKSPQRVKSHLPVKSHKPSHYDRKERHDTASAHNRVKSQLKSRERTQREVKKSQTQRSIYQPKSQQAQRSMDKQQRQSTQRMRTQQPKQARQSTQRAQKSTQQRAHRNAQQRSQHKGHEQRQNRSRD
ncbi:DUF3300 domain-containing protein [Shewanella woodyi]|uniref:DUF3300 domain-containing protein n=1 Tax=Shewanella woodyi TaxID=60961 RepID=UPI0007F8F94A|nr:DUF3300 domain-containing protein [Shewanella woodyi]